MHGMLIHCMLMHGLDTFSCVGMLVPLMVINIATVGPSHIRFKLPKLRIIACFFKLLHTDTQVMASDMVARGRP